VNGVQLGTKRSRPTMLRTFLISGLVVAAAACTFGGAPTPPSSPRPVAPPSPTPHATGPLAKALGDCPVTTPGGPQPPGALPPAPYISSERLWVGLWPQGLVVVPGDDIGRHGSLRMKFVWVRGPGVRGILHITGSEVASGASVRARSAGYGVTGFNASSIFFPGEGCYRVTGEAGGAQVSFVTEVRTCRVLANLPAEMQKRYSANWCSG